MELCCFKVTPEGLQRVMATVKGLRGTLKVPDSDFIGVTEVVSYCS